MSRLARWAPLALLVLLGLTVTARADGGVVQGQVVNRTAGSTAALGGLPVRLYLYSGNALKDTRPATTDARGLFRYEGVPTGAGWSAVATVEYAGVAYESRLMDLSVGTDFDGDISTYETTADDSALHVERSHLIVEMGSGQLEATELIVLENTGDRTYVGSAEVIPGRRATARVPLPAGAADVTFSSEEVAAAMVRTGQGFVDTRPVAPGSHEYVFSYALSCPGPTYSLLKPVLYPTTSIDVLIAAPGAEVEAPALERYGTREASGATYLHLGGRSLNKGADVMIRFSGLGQPAANKAIVASAAAAPIAAAREPWWLVLLPVLALAALGPTAYAYLRHQEPGLSLLTPRQATAALEAERDRLLAQLAELDERFEAGALDQARYRREREAAREALLDLMLTLQEQESDSTSARAARGGRHTGGRPAKKVRPDGGSRRRRPKPG